MSGGHFRSKRLSSKNAYPLKIAPMETSAPALKRLSEWMREKLLGPKLFNLIILHLLYPFLLSRPADFPHTLVSGIKGGALYNELH
ncbi:hypothetical protein AusDCA_0109 [Desulfitobacterium sp. AusDCA]